MLAARKTKDLIAARACKYKRTARLFANARKDHSISLLLHRGYSQTGRGKTPNAERRMQNAEHRMHWLLAVSFTCVCLRLAFICWKGQHFIVFGPFQQIKANRKQTQVKLTASKQSFRRSAFGVLHSAFGVRRSAFYPCRSQTGVISPKKILRDFLVLFLLAFIFPIFLFFLLLIP